MVDIKVISPDGQPGTIPEEYMTQAMAQGYTVPNNVPAIETADLRALSPTGELGSIPRDRMKDAQAQGYKFEGDPLFNHKVKVKDYSKLLENGQEEDLKKLNEKFINEDFLSGDKYKMIQVQPDGSTKDVDVDEAAAKKGLSNGSMRFRSPDAQAFVEASTQVNEGVRSLIDTNMNRNLNSLKRLPGSAVQGFNTGFTKLLEFGNALTPNALIPEAFSNEKLEERNANINPWATIDQSSPTDISKSFGSNIAGNRNTSEQLAQKGFEQLPILAGGEALGLGKLAGAAGGSAAKFIAGEGASALRTGVSEIAGKAISGAIDVSPQSAVQLVVDKDPKGAAETLILGTGLGAAFGLFGKGAEALSKATTTEAQAAMKLANLDQGLARLGVAESDIAAMTTEAKQTALETIAAKGIATEAAARKSVSDIAKGSELKPLVSRLDPFSEVNLSKITPELASYAERGANVIDKMKVEDLINTLSKELNGLAGKSGKISLSDLLEFVDKTGNEINWKAADTDILNQIKKEVFNASRNELLNAGQQAVMGGGAKYAEPWFNEVSTMKIADQLNNGVIAQELKKPLSGLTEAAADWTLGKVIKGILHSPVHAVGQTIATMLPVPGSHAAAGLIGHGINKAIVDPITKFAKSYIGNAENASKLSGTISKLIKNGNSSIPSYLTLDSIHAYANQITKIEPFLKDIAVKGSPAFTATQDPIKHILGDHANGLSKEQQFSALQNQIAKLQSPEVRQAHINDLVSPFAKDHPALADQMAKDYENKIQYLHQIMPKNPNPPKPFQKDDKWKPNKAELDDFNQQLKVANNPFVLLDNLKDGTVTAKQVATASALNPAILNHIQNKINEMAYSGKIDLNYKQRLNASLIMGTAMDDSLRNVQQLQAIYATPQPQNSQPVKQATKGGSHIKADKLPSMLSQGQRLQGK